MAEEGKKYERRKRFKLDHDLIAKSYCSNNADPDWIKKQYVNEKLGFGVFATRDIEKGEFIAEYAGELIESNEGKRRFANYSEDEGSFIFFFNKICIDATNNERIGKYINDSATPNCKIARKVFNSKETLCIFALMDIKKGTEIRYSYGPNAENFWWRKKEYVKMYPFARTPCQLANIQTQENSNEKLNHTRIQIPNIKDFEKDPDSLSILTSAIQNENLKTDFKTSKSQNEVVEVLSDSQLEVSITENSNEKLNHTRIQILNTKDVEKDPDSSCILTSGMDIEAIQIENLKTGFKTSKSQNEVVEVLNASQLEVSTTENSNEKLNHTRIQIPNTKDFEKDPDSSSILTSGMDIEEEERSKSPKKGQIIKNNESVKEFKKSKPTENQKKSIDSCNIFGSSVDIEAIQNENLKTDFKISKSQNDVVEVLNASQLEVSITNDPKNDSGVGGDFPNVIDTSDEERPVTSTQSSSSIIQPANSLTQSCRGNILQNQKARHYPARRKTSFVTYAQASSSSEVSGMSDSDSSYKAESDDSESDLEYSSDGDKNFQSNTQDDVKGVTNSIFEKQNRLKSIQNHISKKQHQKFEKVSRSQQEVQPKNLSKTQQKNDLKISKNHQENRQEEQENEQENSKIQEGNSPKILKTQQQIQNDLTKSKQKKQQKNQQEKESNLDIDSDSQQELPNVSDNDVTNSAITVLMSTHTRTKRSWEKRFPCLLCPKKYPKIARHLEDMHHNNVHVAQAISLKASPNDNKDEALMKKRERAKIFEKLQKRGCFQHNIEVLKEGKGMLIPEKCPTTPKSYKDFLFCQYCYGLYFRMDLARHIARCNFKATDYVPNSKGNSVQGLASMMIPCRTSPSEDLKGIISRMLVDDVSLCLRNDPLIVKYGNILCRKHKINGNQASHISNKLREIAKFLLEMRNVNSKVNRLEDVINPAVFNDVITATITLCKWNSEKNEFETPSLGPKIGMSLKKVAHILKGEAMIGGEETKITLASRFEDLIAMRWNDEIAKSSRIELERRKWNRPKLLPFTGDLQILRDHLKQVSSTSLNELAQNNGDQKAWRMLATSTLSWLILFNRRRGGEAAALTVKDFNEYKPLDINEEVKKSLTDFEIKLCETFKCIEIRGKRSRKVPLMFSKEIDNKIKLLISLRETVGVSKSNPYVFAIPNAGSENNIRGNDALKKHVDLCNLQHPEAICSINLRKHVATLSQLLNLEERELENLANFLGHDISIHREYYRLPDNVLMVAKCGKLLVAMEEGLGNFAGKKLDDIDVSLAEVDENDSNIDIDSTIDDVENAEDVEESSKKDQTNKGADKRKKNANIEKMNEVEDFEDESEEETGKKKKAVRRPWKKEEKDAVHFHFKDFIRNGSAPRQKDIEPILNKEKNLSARKWKDVKNFIHGIHVQQKRKAGILKKSR